MTNFDWPFEILLFGILLSNLDTRVLKTYHRIYLGDFWNMLLFDNSRAISRAFQKMGEFYIIMVDWHLDLTLVISWVTSLVTFLGYIMGQFALQCNTISRVLWAMKSWAQLFWYIHRGLTLHVPIETKVWPE